MNTHNTNMIEISHLHLSFGRGAFAVEILKDVSFTVGKGESFGLVGESGSGKTTVLRCLAGLLSHQRGSLCINGEALGSELTSQRCRLVQMVFQDPYGSLHPRQTVARALREPLIIHRLDRKEERIDEVLLQVGLNPSFRDRFPHQLSGGQRQRVAIARALILEPSVLLLDEPTSALDVSVQAEILNLLSDLREQRGLTYLMVSHDLGVVAHLCDRLAVMQSGQIVEILDVEDLAAGRAAHPYTRQLLEASQDAGTKRQGQGMAAQDTSLRSDNSQVNRCLSKEQSTVQAE